MIRNRILADYLNVLFNAIIALVWFVELVMPSSDKYTRWHRASVILAMLATIPLRFVFPYIGLVNVCIAEIMLCTSKDDWIVIGVTRCILWPVLSLFCIVEYIASFDLFLQTIFCPLFIVSTVSISAYYVCELRKQKAAKNSNEVAEVVATQQKVDVVLD